MEEIKKSVKSEIFDLKAFSFYYPDALSAALDGIDLSISGGDFVLLCGQSGSGKSTLLRQLKPSLAPFGHKKGEIFFCSEPLEKLGHREESEKIGFIFQSPDNQMVTDTVWHELAFGLESLGLPSEEIRRKVAEMAQFFGIEGIFREKICHLSGGQKQLVALASVMVMEPLVLILDEPTSQLDPLATREFLGSLERVNRELGITIILSEHSLEEAMPFANKVLVMDAGKIIAEGSPKLVGERLKSLQHPMALAMPTAMRVWWGLESQLPPPITVAEGRKFLADYLGEHPKKTVVFPEMPMVSGENVITLEEAYFSYDKDASPILRGLSLGVKAGEFYALLGANGAGKSSILKIISGLLKLQRGGISLGGSLGYLPQNPQTLFVKKTVEEDLLDVFSDWKLGEDEKTARLTEAINLCGLEGFLERHPYDLSGGEQQKLALCKLLLWEPDILLLDEPTKGLDASFKEIFAEILEKLLAKKISIFMVSHDIEFVASHAHRCGLLFDGEIVAEGSPRDFFAGNRFYTTAANRMSRGFFDDVITAEDLIVSCGGTVPTKEKKPVETESNPPVILRKKEEEKLPLWRKCMAVFVGLCILFLAYKAISISDLTALVSQSGISALGKEVLLLNVLLLLCLGIFSLAISKKSEKKEFHYLPPKKGKVSKSGLISALVSIILIPFVLYIGIVFFRGQKYYFIALLILLLAMAPFFILFEGRKPKARELVLLASLCAIGVAGRGVLFMFPQCKPVLAICIVVGISLGAETGFFVGASTMLLSNMLFSQGPWTPFQMFALGLIGFLSGIIFRRGLIKPTRLSLASFGLFSSVFIYGAILNPSFALLYASELNWGIISAYYVTGFPMDLIQGIATACFLWYGGIPMLEKLERVKQKYGLL